MLPTEDLIHAFLARITPDHKRGGLAETPRRVSEAWKFWTSGYYADPAAVLKVFDDGAEDYDALVFQGNIPCYSMCEHHLAPFFGVAHIGYIPNKRIVGLSKLARVTDIFARRLQVQERLTTQIANALYDNLDPLAVGVVLRCRHLCMESRGIQRAGTVTYTSALRGQFKEEPEARAEFLRFVERADEQRNI